MFSNCNPPPSLPCNTHLTKHRFFFFFFLPESGIERGFERGPLSCLVARQPPGPKPNRWHRTRTGWRITRRHVGHNQAAPIYLKLVGLVAGWLGLIGKFGMSDLGVRKRRKRIVVFSAIEPNAYLQDKGAVRCNIL